ncbi:hypothetical protein TSUD_192430 [Trifolium subterraneum]|uniref:Uncharacterized protein n=1 Tax=Trifolium subterraneum TaxID=3900 RepID=A0A2Z6PI77_TRISU|nr:hypothetical protein TSUD_192430 [Trifolium subterraneum]
MLEGSAKFPIDLKNNNNNFYDFSHGFYHKLGEGALPICQLEVSGACKQAMEEDWLQCQLITAVLGPMILTPACWIIKG